MQCTCCTADIDLFLGKYSERTAEFKNKPATGAMLVLISPPSGSEARRWHWWMLKEPRSEQGGEPLSAVEHLENWGVNI